MASALTDPSAAPPASGALATSPPRPATGPAAVPELLPVGPGEGTAFEGPLDRELLADLDQPDLVLSEAYVGPERRAAGWPARLRRATFAQRRSLLSLEFAVVAVAVVAVAALVVAPAVRPARADAPRRAPATATAARAHPPTAKGAGSAPAPASPGPAAAASPGPAAAPSTTQPAPAAAPAPAPTAPPASAPPPASSPPLTPAQLGAEALTLVRYPWQQLPGYSIQFLPISDAPSPGFYGNTTFTWGRTGGTSVLYVYPGETVQRLAGITAFEIAHEVDAAAVEPAGGEAQIEGILDYHPSSWAPDCDCAEQNYLSGWYAAAFSNYWSPGVGNWSQLPVAPPSGATLGEVAAWLDPAVP